MRRIPAIAAAAVLFMILLMPIAPTARAQPIYDELPTLEWRTAQADLVLTATISSVRESTDGDGLSTVTLELGPVELLKGTPPARLWVAMPNARFRTSVAEGLAERTQAGPIDLWFLTAPIEGDAYGPIGECISTAFLPLSDPPSVGTDSSWLKKPLPPAVTMDLKRLHNGPSILAAMGRIAGEEPSPAGPDALPPGHSIHLARASTDALWYETPAPYTITVPVDARLERVARRMVLDPGSFLAPMNSAAPSHFQRSRRAAESVVQREGALALATHFESEDNAALLATLLDDPSIGLDRTIGLGEPHSNTYTLRAIAYDALTQWGIDVQRPQLEAPPADIPTAPSPAAIHAVHGPRMDGLISTEFLIELGGDRTPELLRLTYWEAKGSRMAHTLEDLRRGLHNPYAFTLFAFAEGQAIPVFHAGSDNDGIGLQLKDLDGTPALVYQLHTKDPNVYACGWWNMFGQGEGRTWLTRVGHWKDDGRGVEFTGPGPLIWYGFSK